MMFRPRVLLVDENRELRWLGRLLMPGLFDGEHVFRLVPTVTGTRFIHSERFRGILVPMLRRKLLGETLMGFKESNLELKRRAERRNTGG